MLTQKNEILIPSIEQSEEEKQAKVSSTMVTA